VGVTVSQYATEKNIIAFAPGQNEEAHADVDRSGHAIVALLNEAAQVTSAKCERAMEMAHKLSGQIQAAEGRAKQLEAELRHYQDRAFRAEKWLLRVYKEIEDKFLNQNAEANSRQTAHL
jgi:hypothetical protein